uniref:Transmembrane protein 180 n=2 Tax=Caenorhabditis japonica TaxID=281687 RepID=A0A8R1IRA3_CAEJA
MRNVKQLMKASLSSIGLSQFGLSVLQTLFMFYYVKVYMNVFHVNEQWFYWAQTLFMIWNTINDPLFGYLQDVRGSWLNNRLFVIKALSPFLAGSFVIMWIPWNREGSYLEGLHLILSLFLYDAFFSAIGVAWGALFADTTQNQPAMRVKALKYSQIAIMLSAVSIPLTEKMSKSLENFDVFQVICFVFAALSFACLWLGGRRKTEMNGGDLECDEDRKTLIQGGGKEEKAMPFEENFKKSIGLTRQVFTQRQFLAIVIINFFQTARSNAHMNFASIFTEAVIPQTILPRGSAKLSLFFLTLTLIPQILLIVNEKLIARVGAANVIVFSYAVSFFSGFMIFASHNPYVIMLFMLVDCVTVHTIAPLFNIIISDFVDDDARKNNRTSGIPSIIFSLNALVVKPAQSIAPMIIVKLMNVYGYQEYLKTKILTPELKSTLLLILFATPLLTGGIQYVAMKGLFNFRRHSTRAAHII